MNKELFEKAVDRYRDYLKSLAEIEEKYDNRALEKYVNLQITFDQLPSHIQSKIKQELNERNPKNAFGGY